MRTQVAVNFPTSTVEPYFFTIFSAAVAQLQPQSNSVVFES